MLCRLTSVALVVKMCAVCGGGRGRVRCLHREERTFYAFAVPTNAEWCRRDRLCVCVFLLPSSLVCVCVVRVALYRRVALYGWRYFFIYFTKQTSSGVQTGIPCTGSRGYVFFYSLLTISNRGFRLCTWIFLLSRARPCFFSHAGAWAIRGWFSWHDFASWKPWTFSLPASRTLVSRMGCAACRL